MKLGALLPQMDGVQDPVATRDFAQAVEDLGFDHLSLFEHVVGADPAERPPGWRTAFTHRSFLHEPLVLIGYLGAVTRRLEFSTAIIILPQRQTVLFAKQAAEADYLSGGRLRLGLAVGWNAIEFEALNEDFGNRGRRMEEQMQVLRQLWTQEVVDFKGRWHTLDRVGINPRPLQRPIPIWLGGSSDAVLRRTARLADGWLPMFDPRQPASRDAIARLRDYAREAGRPEEAVGIEGNLSLVNSNPEDWLAQLDAWRELRAGYVRATTMGSGFTSLQPHIDLLRRFRELAAGFA